MADDVAQEANLLSLRVSDRRTRHAAFAASNAASAAKNPDDQSPRLTIVTPSVFAAKVCSHPKFSYPRRLRIQSVFASKVCLHPKCVCIQGGFDSKAVLKHTDFSIKPIKTNRNQQQQTKIFPFASWLGNDTPCFLGALSDPYLVELSPQFKSQSPCDQQRTYQ